MEPYPGGIQGEKEVAASVHATGPQDDDDIVYPTGLKLTIITISLCFVILCVALDNTIIATAIPRITDEFHALGDV